MNKTIYYLSYSANVRPATFYVEKRCNYYNDHSALLADKEILSKRSMFFDFEEGEAVFENGRLVQKNKGKSEDNTLT